MSELLRTFKSITGCMSSKLFSLLTQIFFKRAGGSFVDICVEIKHAPSEVQSFIAQFGGSARK